MLCLPSSCQGMNGSILGSSRAVCKICSISPLPSPEKTPGELQREGEGDLVFLQIYFQALSLTYLDFTFFPSLLRRNSNEFWLLVLNFLSQRHTRRRCIKANSRSHIPCLAITSVSQTLQILQTEASFALPRKLPEMSGCNWTSPYFSLSSDACSPCGSPWCALKVSLAHEACAAVFKEE